jgi:crotonobetainyl-CoA:carnitine CoA-transferase CaiB-like acyl-CoA transferase
MMAWGISSALIPAQREGKGQVVDAAIVDGIAYLSSFARSFYQAGHMTDDRGRGWMDGAAPWNRSYGCADGGYITLCAVEAQFYSVLLDTLGISDHQLFAGESQWDKEHWPQQVAHLESLFASRPRRHWCDLLEGTDACFAPVLSYREASGHPHSIARDAYVEVDGEWHPAPAPRFSVTRSQPAWQPSPAEEPAELLRALGLSRELIAAAGL